VTNPFAARLVHEIVKEMEARLERRKPAPEAVLAAKET
jgi:hypothetical protein